MVKGRYDGRYPSGKSCSSSISIKYIHGKEQKKGRLTCQKGQGGENPASAQHCRAELLHQFSTESRFPFFLSFSSFQVNVDDTIEMLPKSRRALTIQEIAALARSSLHGISQVVKDHVTKPTAMAQGRVAHLIEWKGWCKPIDTPAALESDFNSYSDLTEGEQEARFAAGVAEQFAIAEAKLRAWSSVDGDESNDDSYDEDFLPANEPTTQSTGTHTNTHTHTHTHSETSCSQSVSFPLDVQLCQHLGLRTPSELAAKILLALQGGEELLLARLQRGPCGGDCGFHSLGVGGRGIRPCGGQDSPCFSMSYSETYLSPGEDDDTPCKDCGNGLGHPPDYNPSRRVSDVASSGVVSLDEEDDGEEEEEEERAGEPNNQ
uniref:Uncharacterized protein n=1 Tax=Mola mola TaxID=94237 RepID=A0A3Q3W0S3_MOLML